MSSGERWSTKKRKEICVSRKRINLKGLNSTTYCRRSTLIDRKENAEVLNCALGVSAGFELIAFITSLGQTLLTHSEACVKKSVFQLSLICMF